MFLNISWGKPLEDPPAFLIIVGGGEAFIDVSSCRALKAPHLVFLREAWGKAMGRSSREPRPHYPRNIDLMEQNQ